MSSPAPKEIVFKQADGIDIYMDVYLPSSATKAKPAPIILFWHGAPVSFCYDSAVWTQTLDFGFVGGGLLQVNTTAFLSHPLVSTFDHYDF